MMYSHVVIVSMSFTAYNHVNEFHTRLLSILSSSLDDVLEWDAIIIIAGGDYTAQMNIVLFRVTPLSISHPIYLARHTTNSVGTW